MSTEDMPPEHRLTKLAREDLLRLMNDRNKLSDQHRDALTDLLSTYSAMAFMDPEDSLVKAFPLGVGLGKSQSIASWCWAVADLDLEDVSVLICAEQLDELDKMRRGMIHKGVDPERIGFFHRRRGDDKITPCSEGEPDDYQFVLVAHQMVRTRTDIDELNTYRGAERSLTIWDESLVRNEGGFQSITEVEAGLEAVQVYAKRKHPEVDQQKTARQAVAYAKRTMETIKAEYERQMEGAEPRLIDNIEPLDREDREDYKAAISKAVRGKHKATAKDICKFIDLCQDAMRVNCIPGMGDAVISYVPRVPKSLKRLVVLDASCMIRELTKMDSSIEIVKRWHSVKTFEQVSLTQYRQFNGGWSTLEHSKINSRHITFVLDLIKSIPPHESILICSRMDQNSGRDAKKGALQALHRAIEADPEINLDAPCHTPVVADNGRRRWSNNRINIIHWGEHKATSKYSHCKHIIAIGVIRRNEVELASQVAAQSEDLLDERVSSYQDIKRIARSEMFYALQQLIGRGPAREAEFGVARESHIHLLDQTIFEDQLIEEGLPGITWEVPGTARSGSQTAVAAKVITEYLEGLPEDLLKVSSRKIKEDTGLEVSEDVFKAARDLVASNTMWHIEARSMVRG